MKTLIPLFTALALAGCATPAIWTRPDSPPQVRDMDLARCRLQAELAQPDIPISMASDFDGAIRRIKVTGLCMQAMGYSLVRTQPNDPSRFQ